MPSSWLRQGLQADERSQIPPPSRSLQPETTSLLPHRQLLSTYHSHHHQLHQASPQPESADGIKTEEGVASIGSPSSPDTSNTSSPDPASPATHAPIALGDRLYICQVGACGKRYKNLNGLRYHYLHSGSHGLLGLQLLQSGGGASAKVDATGRAPVSTSTLSQEEIAAAAQAAQLAQEQIQAQAAKNAAATAAAAAAASAAAAARKEENERQQTPTLSLSTPPSQLTQSLQLSSPSTATITTTTGGL